MNRHALLPGACFFVAVAATAWAGRVNGPYVIGADVLDAGGQSVTSADYRVDGSVGAIAGLATDAGSVTTVKAGYAGQLLELVAVALTSTPVNVNEGATSQLRSLAVMDDATVSDLSTEIVWLCASPAVAGLDAGGLLTAGAVYTATLARVDGAYLGVTGTTWICVLDSNPDNYGIYAGDGIPDAWQVANFGTNNPDGLANADPFHTGQNNYFKYIAGLDPTNPASLFRLRIAPVPGYANRLNLVFAPRYASRTYIVECRTNLLSGGFNALGGGSTSDSGDERTVTDLHADDPQRFYRVRITCP